MELVRHHPCGRNPADNYLFDDKTDSRWIVLVTFQSPEPFGSEENSFVAVYAKEPYHGLSRKSTRIVHTVVGIDIKVTMINKSTKDRSQHQAGTHQRDELIMKTTESKEKLKTVERTDVRPMFGFLDVGEIDSFLTNGCQYIVIPDLRFQVLERFVIVLQEWVEEEWNTPGQVLDPLFVRIAESREPMIFPPAGHFKLVEELSINIKGIFCSPVSLAAICLKVLYSPKRS